MNKFALTLSLLLLTAFISLDVTAAPQPVQKKHPTCEETTERVLKPYNDRLATAQKALAEYETKLTAKIEKIREFIAKLEKSHIDFELAKKKDLGKLDNRIGHMLDAVEEIRKKIRADIAELNQRAREARAAGRESEAKSYTERAQKLANKLASGEATGHKKEIGWSSSINGWRKHANDTRIKRNKRASDWSAGAIPIHISFLGYSITWTGIQKRLVIEGEKLAAAIRREPGFHLSPLGYTLTGKGIDDLVQKRTKELKDARSRIAAGTFKLHIPIFGFTADRNYAQERMDKAKAKRQKDTAGWGQGTYKTHSRKLGYTTSNGDIQKRILKKKQALADFISAGDKAKVHVPEIGYTTSGEAIKERIQKATTDKIRTDWQKKYEYRHKAIAKSIETKKADIKKWEGFLADFKKQWREDLERQKKHIDTTLTWALGETPCGGTVAATTASNSTITPPSAQPNKVRKLDDIQEFIDFRGLDDKRLSRENWEKWVNIQCDKLKTMVKYYPGVHNKIVIPGETQEEMNKGIVKGYLGDGKLASLLAMDDLPSKNRQDNIYAAVTEQTEAKLLASILQAQPDSLLPWNVMKMALDASGGSYPLAVLTAHAVLKPAAKLGRKYEEDMRKRSKQKKWDEVDKIRTTLRPHSEIAKRLRNLRPKDDDSGDKLGPWYHAFGLLTAGALSSPSGAYIGAQGEHYFKWSKAFVGEGEYNKEKHTTDVIFAKCASSLDKFTRLPLTKEEIDRRLREGHE